MDPWALREVMMSEVWRIDFAGISCVFLQSLIAERTIGCRLNSLHDSLRYKAHELSRDEEPCLKRGAMSEYLHGYASLFNKIHKPSTGSTVSLLYVTIFGIRRKFAISYMSFFSSKLYSALIVRESFQIKTLVLPVRNLQVRPIHPFTL